MVLWVSSPTLDDLEVQLKSLDPVPDSSESFQERIDLLQAMEICPLDLQSLGGRSRVSSMADGNWVDLSAPGTTFPVEGLFVLLDCTEKDPMHY